MSSDDAPLMSKEYHFTPEDMNAKEFAKRHKNPAEGINGRIIDDVVSELGPAFESEGVPPSVLQLLKQLWITKLENKEPEEDLEADESESSFSGFTDQELAQVEAPKPASLGARPKVRFTMAENIHQLDGTNDSSSDEEEIDNDDQDDDDGM